MRKLWYIWSFVTGGVVLNHMDHSFIRVARLNLDEKMCGIGAVHNGRLNKGRVESFKVECAMDVQALTPFGGCHGEAAACLDPAICGFRLILGMHWFGEIYRFICAHPFQQALAHVEEFSLLFGRGNMAKALWFAILKPQPGKKLEAARI